MPREAFCAALVSLAVLCGPATAAPSILIDAASGDVLDQRDATRSWFPASTTKLMTVYVALEAVKAGRISLNTPIVVSPRAVGEAPSKMGFKPGTQVTLDNALKMLMVKSANDIAVTIAEGVSGSVEAFADEMNAAAGRLGMRESHFVNPNGLPDARHVSSARDLALLARELIQRFSDHADLFDIGAMRLGGRIFPTHNGLLGRYPGADGMKTGFTCAAGFNIVASATRGGRRLIAVVLGAPTPNARNMKAVSLFNRGFGGRPTTSGAVTAMPTSGVTEAPDMHDGVCRNRAKAQAQYLADIDDTAIPLTADFTQALTNQPERSFLAFGAASAPQQLIGPRAIAALPRPVFAPVDVFVGPVPGWTGAIAHADNYAGPPASTATAYAPEKTGDAPLKASDDALPMKRGKAVANAHRKTMKVAHAVAQRHRADELKKDNTHLAVKSVAAGKKAIKSAAGKTAAGKTAAGKTAAATEKAPVKTARVAAVKPARGKPSPKAKASDAE